jgi:hypothetical protein
MNPEAYHREWRAYVETEIYGEGGVSGVRLRGYLLFGAGEAAGEVHRQRGRNRCPLPHVRHQNQGEAGGREEVAGDGGQWSVVSGQNKRQAGERRRRGSVVRPPGVFFGGGGKGKRRKGEKGKESGKKLTGWRRLY